jgi:hypothetical protein
MRLHNEDIMTKPKTAAEYCKASGLSGLKELSRLTNKEMHELDEMFGYRFSQFQKVVGICARIKRRGAKSARDI